MEKDEVLSEENNNLSAIYEQMMHKTYDAEKDTKDDKKQADKKQKEVVETPTKPDKSKPDNDKKEEETQEDQEMSKKEEKTSKKTEAKSDEDIEELKRTIHETKKWAQGKNRAYVNAKRELSNTLQQLSEDGTLDESSIQKIMQSVGNAENVEDSEDQPEAENNPFQDIRNKMDAEFKAYSRYNKGETVPDKYEAFYAFFPMLSQQEQKEAFTYLTEESPENALDYVMTQGSDLYDTLYKGMKEKGGLVKYVQSLQKKLNKLEEKSSKLEAELDSTTKKTYNRGSDSKAESTKPAASSVKEFYAARFGR